MKRRNIENPLFSTRDLTGLDDKIQKLQVEKMLAMEKMATSPNAEDVIKAYTYQQSITETQKEAQIKAFLYSPEHEFYNGLGFKASTKSVTYQILRNMSKVHVIRSIISTRIEQIMNYSQYSDDPQKPGWAIRKKLNRFEDRTKVKVKDSDKVKIDKIAAHLENGGQGTKWTQNTDFPDFLKMFYNDSLSLDQTCFEVERTRRGEVISHSNVDSGTIRILETIDPNYQGRNEYTPFKGFYPIYAQVYRDRILQHPVTKDAVVWYPWELSFGVRNKTSDILSNGYGISEMETLIEIVTWILFGLQYNGNFFKQGSNPKGFFSIEGNANPNVLADFRQAWRSMVAGVNNSHKVPVFEGAKVTWQDMQHSNKDMEFQLFNEFLLLLTCAIYRMDPSELGFRFKNQSDMFGQQGQKERIEHSKEKGLEPLLKFGAREINKYIVTEIDPNYEFYWTGIDLEDEGVILEQDVKKIGAGLISLEDGFEKYSGRKFNPEKDTILNPAWIQHKQMSQFGGQDSNEFTDQEFGGEDQGAKNPFDEWEKGLKSDPIMNQFGQYLERTMTKEE